MKSDVLTNAPAEVMIAGQTTKVAYDAEMVPQILTAPFDPYYAEDRRMYQGVPDITITGKGQLWATWMAGGFDEDLYNYTVVASSQDRGKTWDSPRLIVDPDKAGPVRTFDSSVWTDPQGRLWLFWTQGLIWPGEYSGGLWAMVTENPHDTRPTWSKPRKIGGGVLKNKPIVLSNGEWLLPVAHWKDTVSARVYISADQGNTFECRGGASVPNGADRDVDEHRVVERKDGTLWMLVRTQFGIGESTSTDKGFSWTDVRSMPGLKHTPSRFHLGRLKSGNLLLVKHGPIDQNVGRLDLRAFVSPDDGRTWKGGLPISARNTCFQEGHRAPKGVDRYMSYPDAVEGGDGLIYCIYDYSRTHHETLFLAVFTEADATTGEDVSGKVEYGRVVSSCGPNRYPQK